jgi:NAD(P)-dependent dehydrogenase (short-subunit alcohol dehydrogenase family)
VGSKRRRDTSNGVPVDLPPSKSTGREIAEKAVEAGLSMIPLAGGPAAVAFAYAVGRGYNRRLQAWLTQLAEAVDDLVDQVEGLDIDTLAENEDFLDAVATATRAAERTHQSIKIEALRNAVLNAALPTAPDTDTQMMFLRWADEFTGSHLRLLTVLNDPPRWFADHNLTAPDLYMGGPIHIVEAALPEMAGRRDFSNQLLRDLNSAGLVMIDSLNVTQTGASLMQPTTTETGRRFINFISDPRRSRNSHR